MSSEGSVKKYDKWLWLKTTSFYVSLMLVLYVLFSSRLSYLTFSLIIGVVLIRLFMQLRKISKMKEEQL
jgi:hypothetical protein